MTTNTIKEPRPDAKSDPASEPPIASKTAPGVGAARATSEPVESARHLPTQNVTARTGQS